MKEKNTYTPMITTDVNQNSDNEKKSLKKCIEDLNNYVENNIPGRKILTLNFTMEIREDIFPNIILKNIEIREHLGKTVYKFLLSAEKFFNSYPDECFVFGKGLIYNPKDIFDSASQHLIDIFEEMYIYGMKDFFSKREIKIPNFLLEKFVPLIPELCVNYLYEKHSPKIVIEQSGEDFIIDIENLKKWNILGKYAISYSESDNYKIILSKEKTLSDIKYLKDFITNHYITKINATEHKIDIKKFIKKYSDIVDITYPEKIETQYYTPEKIEPCLIFDFENGFITGLADVLYDDLRKKDIQGEISTDAFKVNQALSSVEKILVDNKFTPYNQDRKYCLTGEERMYKFYTEKLKQLPSLCTVFCTTRLTRRKFLSATVSMNILERKKLDISFKINNLNPDETLEVLNLIKDEKAKEYVRLKDGSIIRLDPNNVKEIGRNLMGIGITKEELAKGKIEREKYFNYFINKSGTYDANGRSNSQYFNNLNFTLRSYQRTGVNWLLKLRRNNMGGILADDMGLGKTLQALTFLYINSQKENCKPSLIVVPKSILYNWESEINKYFNSMNYVLINGVAKERRELIQQIAPNQLVFTTYNLISKDIEYYKNIEFDTVILDEAQNIKNQTTISFLAIKKLKRETCFALTGTPIENHIMELWNIFDAVLPGYLKNFPAFGENYLKSEEYTVFKFLISPFILRRMKKDVEKQLPQKIEKDIFVEMESEQKKIYSLFMAESKAAINKDKNAQPFMILRHIFQLRMLCTYPSNILKTYSEVSGKEKVLFELLDNLIQNNHKVVVFSQFTSGLKILDKKLSEKYRVLSLTGEVAAKKRAKLVENFNTGKTDIFLVSLKTGGVGLNMTGADAVIHYDPWWNPAVEAQATDRVHRIGQNKKVLVYNLITKHTIEEYIYSLKRMKRILSKNILETENNLKLSKKELLNIFR